MLFDNFRDKPNEVAIPLAKKVRYHKDTPMEYFASKNTGGPV